VSSSLRDEVSRVSLRKDVLPDSSHVEALAESQASSYDQKKRQATPCASGA
jgi:hypothetical protein